MNLYISDLHFGHANVIGFDNRPFADKDEMLMYISPVREMYMNMCMATRHMAGMTARKIFIKRLSMQQIIMD